MGPLAGLEAAMEVPPFFISCRLCFDCHFFSFGGLFLIEKLMKLL
jgi:hypothetical protein